MRHGMPHPPFEQQTWSGAIRVVLECRTRCTECLATDLSMPEAERASEAILRMTLVKVVLATFTALAGVLSATIGIVDPVRIGVGGSVILGLAYLQQLCASANLPRSLAIIPGLGSRRLRMLEFADALVGAGTMAFLYVAGFALVAWSVATLLCVA